MHLKKENNCIYIHFNKRVYFISDVMLNGLVIPVRNHVLMELSPLSIVTTVPVI